MDSSESSPSSDRAIRRATMMEVNKRRVNEAIERGEQGAGRAVFVCECGFVGCNETVELSIGRYEAVRSDFDRFLIVPGHEIDALEQVVERHPSHMVVVKSDDEARELASASDQRAP